MNGYGAKGATCDTVSRLKRPTLQPVSPVTRPESQRAQPRVDFAAEVHILRPGGRTPIKARSLNLSPNGVFVEADNDPSADCPVGTKLLCDIPLPGGRRYLKGTVARRQAMPSQSTGLGIRFENLEAADQAILHALVQNGADHSRLVKVRFEGMPEALRSRAVVTKDGLQLQTALPFLRLSSAVDVSFIAGETRIETHGTLQKVHLQPQPCDGIPRLAVDVALPEPFAPEEFEPETTPRTGEFGPDDSTLGSDIDDFIDQAAPTRPDAPAPVVVSHASPSTPTLVLHKTATAERPSEATPNPGRTLRKRPPSRIRERRPLPPPQAPPASRLGEGLLTEDTTTGVEVVIERSRPKTKSPWWWVWGWTLLGCVLVSAIVYDRIVVATRMNAHLVQQSKAIADARNDLAEATTLARQAKGAAEATQVATLGLRGAIRREVTAALEGHQAGRTSGKANRGAVADATARPNLRINGNTAVASVPIKGSTLGMIQYSLKDPSGVVVKLPQAQSLLPDGHYFVREGGFKAVWVDSRANGLALRFVYDHTLPRQEMLEVIEAGPDGEGNGHPQAEGTVRVRLRKP